MRIDKPDSPPKQQSLFNKTQHLTLRRYLHSRQFMQIAKHQRSPLQIPHRQFANDKRVHQHPSFPEQFMEQIIRMVNVIRPNHGIDQHQIAGAHFAGRRRRPATNPGWLPPRRASLSAASL